MKFLTVYGQDIFTQGTKLNEQPTVKILATFAEQVNYEI